MEFIKAKMILSKVKYGSEWYGIGKIEKRIDIITGIERSDLEWIIN